MGDDNYTMGKARRSNEASVEINKVDGGFIIRWSEIEIVPDRKRKPDRSDYEIVRRTAVSEKLEDALKLVRRILESDRIIDRKWE